MNVIYEFNSDERRVVQASYQKYLQVVEVIASLHQISGNVTVDPNIGFVSGDDPAVPGKAGE